MKKGLVIVSIVLLVFVVGLQAARSYVVKTGNVALVVNHYSGRIDSRVRHAGFNFIAPFSGSELIEVPTYARTYTMVRDNNEGSRQGDDSVQVNTLSSNTLNVDTSVTYHIQYDAARPSAIGELYRKYRNQFTDFDSFEASQLRPAFRQAIVDAFGAASTSQNMTGEGKRAAADYALKELNARFNPDSIVINEVRVRAVYPDDNTKAALRSRLQAQQNLKLAQLNLQLQQLVNQKAILKAQADAQAAQMRAASLTPRLVRSRHLADIDIVGVPKGSIVNVPSDSGAAAQSGQ